MYFNKQEKTVLNAWFEEHLKPCVVCNDYNWHKNVEYDYLIVDGFKASKDINYMPVVAISCRTCGNTLFFSTFAIMRANPDWPTVSKGTDNEH